MWSTVFTSITAVSLFTVPPVVSCICKGKNCQDDDLCTLDPSTNQSCYIIFEKLGSIITRRQGCSTKCKEYHRDSKIRKCCQEDKCNNEAIPTVWPSPPSAVVTATPAPPTTDSVSSDILTSEQPTTLGPRRPTELKCHCSDCRNGMDTCLATVACASRVVETVKMTWCIADEFTCKNNSFQLDCCYEDYCNGPSRPIPGPPCDDEDTESSGGCDFGKQFNTMHQLFDLIFTDWYSIAGSVTSSTTLSSPITTTSTSTVSSEATPTSTNKATPTESITKDTDTETQYDNSEMMMVFYFFTILLSVCIITMIIVVVACVVMVCHYRGMAYKTVLSSSTILESAMKEKGFPITNSSTV